MAVAGPAVYWYFSLFYVLAITGFGSRVLQILLVFLALILSAAWGFLLNDLFDRYADSIAGRTPEERGHTLSMKTLGGVVVMTAGLSWGLIFAAGGNLTYKLVLAAAYILSFLYSVPPIKLKSRAFLGFLADSLMERPLPILVIFASVGYYGIETILFPILTELIRSVFKHQADDYEKDALANVRTFAVSLGRDLTHKIVFNVLNPLSVLATLAFGVVAWINLPSLRWIVFPIILVMAVGVLLSLLLQRQGLLRSYTTLTDPPYIMFLSMAYKVLLLPALAFGILILKQEFYPLMILLAISLAPHLKYYGGLIPIITRDFLKATARRKA